MPAAPFCHTVFMEHEQNIPLQLMCLFPWSSDGEAVLRNWNRWDISLAWHTWASRAGLWRCHVSVLVLTFLPTATMGQPYAPSDMTSIIPAAMCSPPWWTEKLWNYEKTKTPFPLTRFCQIFCHSDEVTAPFTVHIPRGLSLGAALDASPQHWPW